MLTDALRRVRRDTAWSLIATIPIGHDVGHPQGMTRWGEHWLVTTVHAERRVGEVFVVTSEGELVDRRDLVDGDRFHPGGVSADDDGGVWIALAEYRPRSTTSLLRLDRDLEVVANVTIDDHLGAVCPLADGSLVAVSWASTRWYRLDVTGAVLDRRRGANRYVDIQDLQPVTDGTVVGTGFGRVMGPTGPVALGGVSLVDAETLAPIHESPVAAWMPSGRPATYNASHVDARSDGRLELHCLVDDRTAAIGRWVADTPAHSSGAS